MNAGRRLDRRTMLVAAAAAGASLALPLDRRGTRARADAPPRSDALPHGRIELSARPANYEARVSAFTQRITPIDRFYVRGHFDAPTAIDAAAWRLEVGGLVDVPQRLGLLELERLPQHEVEAVLQCAGNGRALMRPRVAGVQWTKGAMGNARWRGPRLKDVLALARPRAEGRMLELEGHDRPVLPSTPSFIRGVPMAKALHDDTIVALSMNGAPLPHAHGAPARLVVPGWVADDWVKWLARITVLDGEPQGFFYQTAYRFPSDAHTAARDPGVAPPAEVMRPMERLNVKSIIGAPLDGAALPPGALEMVGVAFSGEQRVARVDVSIDGGAWQRARIVDDGGRYGFSVFSHRFERAAPGAHVLRARATDDAGAVQPATPLWNPSGYLHNAIDEVRVEVLA